MAVAESRSLTFAVARPGLASPDLVARAVGVAALVAWSAVVIASRAGVIESHRRPLELLLYAVPVLAGAAVALSRPHSPGWARFALTWSAAVTGAILSVEHVGNSAIYAIAPAVVIAATALALRFPIQMLLAGFLLSGGYHTLKVYTPAPTGQLMDLVLASAWLALIYSWVSGRRELPAAISPALLLLGLYLVATAIAAAFAPDTTRSIFSFRSSAWLMTLVFLVPMWASNESRRRLLQKAVLVIGAGVGAYACLRYVIGPGNKENVSASTGTTFVQNDLNETRLFGSLPSPQALAIWSAAMFAFALASTLTPIGTRWRLLGAAVAAMNGVAIFGADVRFGMVAAAAGGVTVVALFAIGRGFAGRRALPLAVVVVLASIGIGFFVTTKLTAAGTSATRFQNLVTDPIGDNSVQQRFVKWRTLLAQVDDKPFGAGLGASGAAEKKYARFTTNASIDPDSSFIKIAYDQGFLVLILFGAALIAMLVALALKALETQEALVAGRALGSCGALASFIVAMAGAIYFEGLIAVGPWFLVSIGCCALIPFREQRAS